MIFYKDCSFFGEVFRLPDNGIDYFCNILDWVSVYEKDYKQPMRITFTENDLLQPKYKKCIREIRWDNGNSFKIGHLGEFIYLIYDDDEPLMLENVSDACLYAIWNKILDKYKMYA